MVNNNLHDQHIENTKPPVVLAVSGLDPTGSAGLIADVRVLHSLGCHPCGVVTCETVQSSRGLTGIRPSNPDIFSEQLRAIINDIPIKAVKIGALNSVEIIEALGEILKLIPGVPVVLDPVFAPTEGQPFLDMDGMRAMSVHLLGRTLVATPNVHELGAPASMDVDPDDDEMILGFASGWFGAGVEALLVTGLIRDGKMVDRLLRVGTEMETKVYDFSHPIHPVGNVHGTGCVLSSALAGYIAKGEKLKNAVMKASEYASRVIEHAVCFGEGSRFWEYQD